MEYSLSRPSSSDSSLTEQRFPIERPLRLSELLDRAFRLYRQNFRMLVLTAAVFLLPFSIINGLIFQGLYADYIELFQTLATNPDEIPPELFAEDVVNPLAYILVFPLSIFSSLMVTLSLIAQCNGALLGQKLTLWQGIRKALSRFWAMFGMLILAGLAGLVVMAGVSCVMFGGTFAVIGGGVAFFDTAGDPGPAAAIGLAVGMFFLIIFIYALILAPLAYLGARWVAAPTAIVAERLGPIEAIKKSWTLTKGSVLRIIGLFLLLMLLSIVFTTIQYSILGSLTASMLFFAPRIAGGIIGALSGVVSVIWQPLIISSIVLLYYELRVRSEGYDIVSRIEQMERELGLSAGNIQQQDDSISGAAIS